MSLTRVRIKGYRSVDSIRFPVDDLTVFVGQNGVGKTNLSLVGALCAFRPLSFIALNEPESSLHPSLISPLARLIANAAARTRIWVVTHSEPLAEALAGETGVLSRRIEKRVGATWIEGLSPVGHFTDC